MIPDRVNIADRQVPIGAVGSTFELEFTPTLNQLQIPRSLTSDRLGRRAVQLYSVPIQQSALYGRTSAGRAMRVTAREVEESLWDYIADEKASAELCMELANYEQARTELQAKWATIVQPTNRHTLQALLRRESEFLDISEDPYGTDESEGAAASVAEIQAALDRNRSRDGIGAIVADVIETYSTTIAELVVLLALDPPGLETAVQRSEMPTEIAHSFRPKVRFERLVETLDDLSVGPHAASINEVADRLRNRLDENVDTVNESGLSGILSVTPREEGTPALPLLELPARAGSHHGAVKMAQSDDRQLSSLVLKSFTEANVGTVLYPTRTTEKPETRWQTNPLVQRRQAEEQPYALLWQQAVVTAHVVGTLHRRTQDRSSRDEEIICPICAMSIGFCGPDSCRFDANLSRIEECETELIQQLRQT